MPLFFPENTTSSKVEWIYASNRLNVASWNRLNVVSFKQNKSKPCFFRPLLFKQTQQKPEASSNE